MSSTKAKDFLIEKGFNGFANHSLVPRWMDEYAQQQERVTAIAFAEWLSNYDKGIVPRNENGKVVWYFNDGESVYNGSTESVYELYLNQTNQ